MTRNASLAARIAASGLLAAGLLTAAISSAALADGAEKLRIVGEETSFTVETAEGTLTIERVMTACAKNKGWLQEMIPVPGVTPVGEIEVLDSMKDPDTLLIDMREVDWFVDGTIPTAVNIPYTLVAERLDELGCEKTDGGDQRWDCSNAKKIVAFCNGPVCPQSPTAIKAMDREGFPMEKVFYYRGGMLDWDALGLTKAEGGL